MAGYSGTPLAKKLGIREGARVALVGAPEGFEELLGALPPGAKAVRGLRGSALVEVIVSFVTRAGALEEAIEKGRARMAESGGLWIAWPKKASGVKTDVTEDVVRRAALEAGLVDNKVCAIDEVWSGLRLVVRARDRKR